MNKKFLMDHPGIFNIRKKIKKYNFAKHIFNWCVKLRIIKKKLKRKEFY